MVLCNLICGDFSLQLKDYIVPVKVIKGRPHLRWKKKYKIQLNNVCWRCEDPEFSPWSNSNNLDNMAGWQISDFQAKMPNITLFKLVWCEDLLLYFLFYVLVIIIRNLKISPGSLFIIFWHSIHQMIYRLQSKKIMGILIDNEIIIGHSPCFFSLWMRLSNY